MAHTWVDTEHDYLVVGIDCRALVLVSLLRLDDFEFVNLPQAVGVAGIRCLNHFVIVCLLLIYLLQLK